MFPKWFTYLPGLRQTLSRRDRRSQRPTRPGRPRLCIETLEVRAVPAVVTWDGGGGNFNWNTAANWSADVLPGPSDDVEIGTSFAAATITSTSNVSIHSLTSQASLIVSGGELLAATDSHLYSALTVSGTFGGAGNTTVAGLFAWNNGTLQGVAGAGSLTANGGTAIVGSYATLSGGFHYLNPVGQSATWRGEVRMAQGATFENAGTIDLLTDGYAATSEDVESEFLNSGTLVKTAEIGRAHV